MSTLAASIERLRLSAKLVLPLDAVKQTFVILSRRNVRGTHAATVLVEEMVSDRLPVVVVDSLGVWHGLRLSADGRQPGLPVHVLGGRHGEAPLEGCSSSAIADRALDGREALVLDVSGLSKGAAQRLVKELAAHLSSRRPVALHLVLDDAHTLVPEHAQGGSDPIIDLLRSRGALGVGVTLVSQHPAAVNPAIWAQVETLIVAKMQESEDLGAVARWIQCHAEPTDSPGLVESLRSLPPREAWFWSPRWLGIRKRVRIRDRATYDGLTDRRVGGLRPRPSQAAEAELHRLLARLGASSPADHGVQARTEQVATPGGSEGSLASVEQLAQLLAEVAQRLVATVATLRTPSELTPPSEPTPMPIPSFRDDKAVRPTNRGRKEGRTRGRPMEPLILTSEENSALRRYAQDYRISPSLAEKARVVLECAEGRQNGDVARDLTISRQTVGKWRREFVEHRLEGLSFNRNRLPRTAPPALRRKA